MEGASSQSIGDTGGGIIDGVSCGRTICCDNGKK